jgi:Fur family ferric uptake transcriptional regulator
VPDEREQALQRSGLRVTKPRLAVLRALENRTEAVTAQDLHHELRSAGESAGLATVYRTLASLVQAGVLDTFWREGEQAFRLCGDKHHHHLVCNDCGAVEEVSSEALESWVHRTAKAKGFTVTSHSAEVYGICADCR